MGKYILVGKEFKFIGNYMAMFYSHSKQVKDMQIYFLTFVVHHACTCTGIPYVVIFTEFGHISSNFSMSEAGMFGFASFGTVTVYNKMWFVDAFSSWLYKSTGMCAARI